MNLGDNKNQINRLEPFLMEYFKYLREEINLRVTKHSYLVIYKLISVGAILAFILGSFRSSIELINLVKNTQYLIWIVPLVGMVFDMIILGNLRVVANIGLYIKKYYEEGVLNKWKEMDDSLGSFEFWESCGAHEGLKWKCYTKFDMMAIYSVTLFLILLPLMTMISLIGELYPNLHYWINLFLGGTITYFSFKIFIMMRKLVSD